jgi:hypothetical protein
MHSLALIAFLGSSLPLLAQEPAGAVPKTKLDLRVLYAGAPEHPRTQLWRDFLGGNVREVQVLDWSELSKETAAGFDVIVVDTPDKYVEKDVKVPPAPKLDRTFTRPVVALGVAAGTLFNGKGMDLKLDWL